MNASFTFSAVYTNCSNVHIKLGTFDSLSSAKDKCLSFARSNPIPSDHTFIILFLVDGHHFKTNYYFYDLRSDSLFCRFSFVSRHDPDPGHVYVQMED